LVASGNVSLNEVPPTVAAEALNTPSGTVLYDSGLQPREATSAALSQWGARMDPAGTMTLGNASASTLTGQSNLRAMAASVARETGVARITLNRTATGWTFDGAINPTVFGLVTYTDKNPGLDGLMKDIERSVGLTNPDKEFLKSICREAARRFGAQVTFTDTRWIDRFTRIDASLKSCSRKPIRAERKFRRRRRYDRKLWIWPSMKKAA
jgi:hypothetical protein